MKDAVFYRTPLRHRRHDLAEEKMRIARTRDDRAVSGFGRSGQDEMLDTPDPVAGSGMTRIEAALDRLTRGRFGRCMTCGEAIPGGRSTSVPDAGHLDGARARYSGERAFRAPSSASS